ncbi:MAG TPA: hypothetical protein VI999_00105 [Thermoplasmata archaeon]|nr:hypothetical protein [Thermoplasmata archaeon]
MPAYTYGGGLWAYARTKEIDRTKTGILLLLIGTLLSWIPYGIAFIGYILLLVGAILVILGRKAFGPAHSRNVVLAIVFFFVGVIGIVVLTLWIIFAAVAAGISGNFAGLISLLNTYFIALIILAAITGLASVFFTYALQNEMGKILLWAGYGANLALNVAVWIIINPMITTVADPDVLLAQADSLSLLAVVPSALFAAADYLVWTRISRGEIPAPTPAAPMPPQAAPAWNPPSPPTPPASPPPSGPAPPINPQ